jgi:dipeptidyl-peptidase 4
LKISFIQFLIKSMVMKKIFTFLICLCLINFLSAQALKWTKDGNAYLRQDKGEIVQFNLPDMDKKVLVSKEQLTPTGKTGPLSIKNYFFTEDNTKVLIFTNSKRVWRYETRGDYWVLDLKTNKLNQLGTSLPESSLMFAKLSSDGSKAAYVSDRNVYVEDLATAKITKLTETNGTPKLINGTFDWVYEEEFDCRDGFRWSPDGKKIAYWQIDANQIRNFNMINTIDSIYPTLVPVEYPKVGENPSPYKIGVVDIDGGKTTWMQIPGVPNNTYVPRMEWAANSTELIIQQMNRKQNETQIMYCDAQTGKTAAIYKESDEAWIDVMDAEMVSYWTWLDNNKAFLWESEKDGWRHLYRISRDGKKETLVTNGNFDVMGIVRIDEKNGDVYYYASPENATQKYLYRSKLSGEGKAERLSPANQKGTHTYDVSSNGKYAQHTFMNYYTPRMTEWVTLPDNKPLTEKESIAAKIKEAPPANNNVEFFQVTTVDGITMDGWMEKPKNFDATKKYPILFNVYSEPAGATVRDVFGINRNSLFKGDMAEEGYIYASLDGRGTPAPKGKAWRKAIYRKIGIVNIRDQAMGATEMFKKWSFIDTSRVAVHGWSGGGSATLNLLFQYPDIYKTGISVAAVANQLTYDNIYQERYMGIPQENREDFVKGSPITYAKNLRGNLLYIHGTGDDNVHYQNAEMLVNELIKHNKQFQFMPYPNRSHGIYEGEGTSLHLATLFTNYLRQYCPAGPKTVSPKP